LAALSTAIQSLSVLKKIEKGQLNEYQPSFSFWKMECRKLWAIRSSFPKIEICMRKWLWQTIFRRTPSFAIPTYSHWDNPKKELKSSQLDSNH
jgi:hypothetical protein